MNIGSTGSFLSGHGTSFMNIKVYIHIHIYLHTNHSDTYNNWKAASFVWPFMRSVMISPIYTSENAMGSIVSLIVCWPLRQRSGESKIFNMCCGIGSMLLPPIFYKTAISIIIIEHQAIVFTSFYFSHLQEYLRQKTNVVLPSQHRENIISRSINLHEAPSFCTVWTNAVKKATGTTRANMF